MIGRILFCGDREWVDYPTVRECLSQCLHKYGRDIAIIQGSARGADHMASAAALEEELTVWFEPAKWSVYGNKAGPIRNQLMLDRYKPHLVIAIHANLAQSKGTGHMVSISRQAGIPVIHIKDRTDAENIKNELPEMLYPAIIDGTTKV